MTEKDCPPAEVGSAGGRKRDLRVGGPVVVGKVGDVVRSGQLPGSRVRPRVAGRGVCELHARPLGARRIHPLASLLEPKPGPKPWPLRVSARGKHAET